MLGGALFPADLLSREQSTPVIQRGVIIRAPIFPVRQCFAHAPLENILIYHWMVFRFHKPPIGLVDRPLLFDRTDTIPCGIGVFSQKLY